MNLFELKTFFQKVPYVFELYTHPNIKNLYPNCSTPTKWAALQSAKYAYTYSLLSAYDLMKLIVQPQVPASPASVGAEQLGVHKLAFVVAQT
jgi:hypothetical protein